MITQFWLKGMRWSDRKFRCFTEQLTEVSNALIDLEVDHIIRTCPLDLHLSDVLIRSGSEQNVMSVSGLYEVKP